MQSRLIENNDVLHEVFRFLDPSETERDNPSHENSCRRALVQCACASKLLSEHALNVLWRKIEGLLDLFSILPSFKRELPREEEMIHDAEGLFEGSPPRRAKGLWRFTGPVVQKDWQRFVLCTQRVRVLSLAWTPGKIDPSVFAELSRLNSGEPLFPGLIELDIQTYDPFEAIPSSLVSYSIRKLLVTDLGDVWGVAVDSPPPSPLADLVRVAFVKARHLEEVSLTGPNVGPMENLLPMAECSHLRRVSVVDVAPDARLLRGWSRIGALVDLTLEVHPDNPVITQPLEFSQLHCLTARGSLQYLGDLFRQFSAPVLNYLRMEVQQLPGHGREQLPECLSAVSARFGSSLRQFFFVSSGDGLGRGESWPEQPLVELIRPLLDMRLLQTVSITPPRWWSITLSDDGVRDIVTAWPMLSALQIYLLHWHSNTSTDGLLEFAKSCPNLHNLALPHLDLRTFASSTVDNDNEAVASHSLRVLALDYSFGHNQADDSHKFALFLDHTFPYLDLEMSAIRRVDVPGGPHHPLALEVIELLRTFRRAREQHVARSPNGKRLATPKCSA